jgi:hypothetical protein
VGELTGTRWRLLRAGVFALVATQLAALGHVVGGGHLPDPAMLLTIGVFLGGSLSGLCTRRRTGPQIFAMLVASQVVFHFAFQVTVHHASSVDAGRMIAFHLIAALGAAWVMSSGESTLFRLFAALHRVVRWPTRGRPAVELAPTWTAVITGGAEAVRLRAGARSLPSRRGPPLAV